MPGLWKSRGCHVSIERPSIQALAMEPNLAPNLRTAVQVPDDAMDAFRLAMSFFAGAKAYGARIRPFCEVEALVRNSRAITGVAIRDHRYGRLNSNRIN